MKAKCLIFRFVNQLLILYILKFYTICKQLKKFHYKWCSKNPAASNICCSHSWSYVLHLYCGYIKWQWALFSTSRLGARDCELYVRHGGWICTKEFNNVQKDCVSPQELIIKHLPAHHLFTLTELLCKYLMLFNIYVNLLFSWQTWARVRKCFIVQPALHLSTFYKTGFKVLWDEVVLVFLLMSGVFLW